MCVLTKYAGQDERCYPSQRTLAKDLGCTDRYVRKLLCELLEAQLITKKRTGFNKSNTYTISKDFVKDHRNNSSPQIGSAYPLHSGNSVPPKNTYRKGKSKRSFEKGMQSIAEVLNKHHVVIPNRGTTLKGK